MHAAEHGANPRDELAWIERFRQVVVRAELKAHDSVDVVAARREHDDGEGRFRANASEHVEAAEPRQHHVEHDEGEALATRHLETDGPVVRHLDLEPFGC